MGVSRVTLIAVALLLCAPLASAWDPLYDQVCVTVDLCAGVGTCVADVACVPRGCAPFDCRTSIWPDEAACFVNVSIDGRTCAFHVGTFVGPGDGSGAWVAAESSNGSVLGYNLPNTWIAPGAELNVHALGFDLGYVYLYLYTSDIDTEGPRGGPLGTVSASENHTWTEVGAAAGHRGGPFFGEEFVVGVELLDLMPEGCWVRSPGAAFPEYECPSLAPLYP